jgi:hypothetical protein
VLGALDDRAARLGISRRAFSSRIHRGYRNAVEFALVDGTEDVS